MKCSKCNAEINTRLIKGMCSKCYQREKANAKKPIYDLPKYGEVKYAPDGTVICHICGRSYRKLMAHVVQSHGLTEKEYKKEFGLIYRQGLISGDLKDALRAYVEKNYDKVVIDNLIRKGKDTQFTKDNKGYHRRVSEQEKQKLIKRAEESNYKNLKYSKKGGD